MAGNSRQSPIIFLTYGKLLYISLAVLFFYFQVATIKRDKFLKNGSRIGLPPIFTSNIKGIN